MHFIGNGLFKFIFQSRFPYYTDQQLATDFEKQDVVFISIGSELMTLILMLCSDYSLKRQTEWLLRLMLEPKRMNEWSEFYLMMLKCCVYICSSILSDTNIGYKPLAVAWVTTSSFHITMDKVCRKDFVYTLCPCFSLVCRHPNTNKISGGYYF